VQGFHSGDSVTIVAERTADGSFLADEIFGGSREQLITNTRLGASLFRYMGYGFMCVSAIAGIIFAAIALLVFRQGRTTSAI
jgi:hypothetical protein